MARIRSVKPELRTSLVAAEWPRDVRYLWVLLWGYLDDHGRGVDNNRLVLADCFPLDRDIDETTIESWLDMIAKSGPLCRYTVNGRHYFHATNWREHQKPSHPTDSRIPPCPFHETPKGSKPQAGSHSGTSPEPLANPSGTVQELFVPEQLIGDVVRDGDGDVVAPATDAPEPGFEEFWTHWPRKVSRPDAEKAFEKAVQKDRANPTAIVAACISYADRCRLVGQDPKFIPHPATWLNRKSWNDDLDAAMPLPTGRSSGEAPTHQAFRQSDQPKYGRPTRRATS